jgi:hypothetical protein
MPQERKWIPSVVKEEDRQCWEDILRNHGTNISGSLLALNGLEEFVRVNDGFPGCSRDEILRMYAGQNARHGMAASTIAARLECFQSFRVDPRNVGAARERVHACATVSAVRRWRGSAGATNVKPLLPKETWADVLEAPRPPSMKEETHSFWRLRFLVIVITGCRPAHILGIREIQIRGEAMGVKWGARKILITPPTDYVWYPFAWSGVTPPPDLLRDDGRIVDHFLVFVLARSRQARATPGLVVAVVDSDDGGTRAPPPRARAATSRSHRRRTQPYVALASLDLASTKTRK